MNIKLHENSETGYKSYHLYFLLNQNQENNVQKQNMNQEEICNIESKKL